MFISKKRRIEMLEEELAYSQGVVASCARQDEKHDLEIAALYKSLGEAYAVLWDIKNVFDSYLGLTDEYRFVVIRSIVDEYYNGTMGVAF